MIKILLLPLLAALALPTAIKAESDELGVAKIQFPRIKMLSENATKFFEMEDYYAACNKQRQANSLIEINFEGLQEIRPEFDWFIYRKLGLQLEELACIMVDE